MSLIRTSLLNGIVVAVRIGTALVLNKIFAVIVGPSGYAAIGQFQNAVSVAVSVSTAGISAGVTKETASNSGNAEVQHAVWRTAFRIMLITSGIGGVAICAFSSPLSFWLLNSGEYNYVFVFLGACLPAIIANNLLLALVNGKKDIPLYVKANILGSFIVLVLAGALTVKFGLTGGLIAFAISPAFGLVATIFFLRKREWFRFRALLGRTDRHSRNRLFRFGLMGVVGAIAMPLAYIAIRQRIAAELGIEAAGYWQAVWRISEVYLMLITTTLSVYFLPRIGEILFAKELKCEVVRIYKFVVPVVIASALSIYFLREFIIQSLFTADFGPMRELFFWQLVGDGLKIGSWVFGYILLGRAMVKSYVAAEIACSALFFALVTWLIPPLGLQGVPVAYAVTYLLYWIYVCLAVVGELRRMPSHQEPDFGLEKL